MTETKIESSNELDKHAEIMTALNKLSQDASFYEATMEHLKTEVKSIRHELYMMKNGSKSASAPRTAWAQISQTTKRP